jgi:hypothetical protein
MMAHSLHIHALKFVFDHSKVTPRRRQVFFRLHESLLHDMFTAATKYYYTADIYAKPPTNTCKSVESGSHVVKIAMPVGHYNGGYDGTIVDYLNGNSIGISQGVSAKQLR